MDSSADKSMTMEEQTWSNGQLQATLANGVSVVHGPGWIKSHQGVQALLIISDTEILVARTAAPEEWEEPYISRESLVTDLLTIDHDGLLSDLSNHSGKGRLTDTHVALCIKRLDDAHVYVVPRCRISIAPTASLHYSYANPFGAIAPNFSWANGGGRLAVSCEGKLWYWSDGASEFTEVGCFDNDVVQDTGARFLVWSPDDKWIAAAGTSASDAYFPGIVDGTESAYDAYVDWMMKVAQRQLCDLAVVDTDNEFRTAVRIGYRGFIKEFHWSADNTFAVMIHRSRSLHGVQTFSIDPHRGLIMETDTDTWDQSGEI